MPKTLKDYRPQHDEDCGTNQCQKCMGRRDNDMHDAVEWPVSGCHDFTPFDCDCGLDTALAAFDHLLQQHSEMSPQAEAAKHARIDHALARTLLSAVKALAAKGYRHLDDDEESKAMKVLSALAGVTGCYPEIDKLYAQIGSGTQATKEQAVPTHRSAAL
jgi:hypothetical protein